MELRLRRQGRARSPARQGHRRGIARGVRRVGAKVMLSSRKTTRWRRPRPRSSGDVAVFAANAGDIDAAEACVAATIERFGAPRHPRQQRRHQPVLRARPSASTRAASTRRSRSTCAARCSGRQAAWKRAHEGARPASSSTSRRSAGCGPRASSASTTSPRPRSSTSPGSWPPSSAPTRVVGIAPGLVKTDFAALLVENFGDDAGAPACRLRRLGEPRGHRQPGHVPRQRRGRRGSPARPTSSTAAPASAAPPRGSGATPSRRCDEPAPDAVRSRSVVVAVDRGRSRPVRVGVNRRRPPRGRGGACRARCGGSARPAPARGARSTRGGAP